MSQIMRGSLLSLSAAFLLVLPWFDGLAVGEVSPGFKDCLRFFYNETLPSGLEANQFDSKYQPICQCYKGKYRFASLYNKENRTPLFSAYILSPSDKSQPNKTWMYEPQLADPNSNPEMQLFSNPVPRDVNDSQAVRGDYRNSGFSKGHLAPSGHHNTAEDKNATFTLTNIVPQVNNSNSGPWNQWEKKMKEKIYPYCAGEMYVITGVIPYMETIHWINNRVAVPEYIWSAYCCPEYSKNLPEETQTFFPTYGAVGRNDRNSGEEIVPTAETGENKGYEVSEMPLETLEGILSIRLNQNRTVNLFYLKCLTSEDPSKATSWATSCTSVMWGSSKKKKTL